jgi:hypothetical protein
VEPFYSMAGSLRSIENIRISDLSVSGVIQLPGVRFQVSGKKNRKTEIC